MTEFIIKMKQTYVRIRETIRTHKWLDKEVKSICALIPCDIKALENMDYLLIKKDLELLVKFEEYFPNHDEQNSPFERRTYAWQKNNLNEYIKWLRPKEETENEVNKLLNRIYLSSISSNSQTLLLVIKKISKKHFFYPITSSKNYKKLIFLRAIHYINEVNHINGYPNFILSIKFGYEQLLQDLSVDKIKFSDYQTQIMLWIEEINQKFSWQYILVKINHLDPDMIVIKGDKNKEFSIYSSLHVFHDKVFRKKIVEEILPLIRKLYAGKVEKEKEKKFNDCKKWSELISSFISNFFRKHFK